MWRHGGPSAGASGLLVEQDYSAAAKAAAGTGAPTPNPLSGLAVAPSTKA